MSAYFRLIFRQKLPFRTGVMARTNAITSRRSSVRDERTIRIHTAMETKRSGDLTNPGGTSGSRGETSDELTNRSNRDEQERHSNPWLLPPTDAPSSATQQSQKANFVAADDAVQPEPEMRDTGGGEHVTLLRATVSRILPLYAGDCCTITPAHERQGIHRTRKRTKTKKTCRTVRYSKMPLSAALGRP